MHKTQKWSGLAVFAALSILAASGLNASPAAAQSGSRYSEQDQVDRSGGQATRWNQGDAQNGGARGHRNMNGHVDGRRGQQAWGNRNRSGGQDRNGWRSGGQQHSWGNKRWDKGNQGSWNRGGNGGDGYGSYGGRSSGRHGRQHRGQQQTYGGGYGGNCNYN